MRTMLLPRARVGVWAAAAKVAQRRHRVEDAGRSQSPAAQSERAALYVHVSGKEEAELWRRGRTGRNPHSDLSRVSSPAYFPRPRRGLG